MSNNSRFLYVRNGGNGTISGFRVQADGSLTPVNSATGLPPGAAGSGGVENETTIVTWFPLMCTRVVRTLRTPKALCSNATVRAGYNGLESRAEAYRYGSEDDGTRHRGRNPVVQYPEIFEAHEALEAGG